MKYFFQAGQTVSPRPHMFVVEAGHNTYELLSEDVLSIRGFEKYTCNNYHLGNG